MPVYALLGATGSSGRAILRALFLHPNEDITLNIFVRSRAKLEKAFLNIEMTTTFQINFFEGTSSDSTILQQCLKDVDVVMACIGSNISTPGISLITDTANAIISALQSHQQAQGPVYEPPTIIQLRSLSLNPLLKARQPWLAQICAPFCFYHIYADLERACNLFAGSPGLLSYIFIDPPSIHDADGTTPTGYRLVLDEDQAPSLSYADLGAAFCEVAERRDEFAGNAVGVTATGPVNETWGVLMGYMASGVKGRMWG